ncbi:uncharacterized [Tachysurus ichikawai]
MFLNKNHIYDERLSTGSDGCAQLQKVVRRSRRSCTGSDGRAQLQKVVHRRTEHLVCEDLANIDNSQLCHISKPQAVDITCCSSHQTVEIENSPQMSGTAGESPTCLGDGCMVALLISDLADGDGVKLMDE